MRILRFLWQLPQHILAGLFLAMLVLGEFTFTMGITRDGKGRFVIYSLRRGSRQFIPGASLGEYVFVSAESVGADNKVISHEIGHTRQSRMLGPLYLLVVGLPSLANNLLSRVSKKVHATYYRRYPEAWADRLGGVERE